MSLRFHMVLDQVWVAPPLPPDSVEGAVRIGDRILLGGEDCWLYGMNDARDRLVVLREGWERTWSLTR